MMASAAVIGLSARKRLLSSFYYSNLTEKLSCGYDYGSTYHQAASTKNVITTNKSSNNSTSFLSNQHTRSLKAQKENVNTASEPSIAEVWLQRLNHLEEDRSHSKFSVEALLLLQKSMLEKQWNLSTETVITDGKRENTHKKMQVTGSGTSTRKRRIDTRRKVLRQNCSMIRLSTSKQLKYIIRPELL
ncbi:RNA polymerase sigma factor sigA [Camellia lanceoleosa]|uniref:RNA polymerase sigma factor sigA n=1 Tax=Camellia lanceoleosa TaxID=1840588 RepID=A0ACC0G3P7_9ERIC|nr:RNA polymerase sigma factor sigA [Camellia lanceoleosa]